MARLLRCLCLAVVVAAAVVVQWRRGALLVVVFSSELCLENTLCTCACVIVYVHHVSGQRKNLHIKKKRNRESQKRANDIPANRAHYVNSRAKQMLRKKNK